MDGTFLIDILRGDAAPNRIQGAGGIDILDGRKGVDDLLAGPGNDEVNARDGGPDTVDCGDGADTAIADREGVDALTGCETVQFAPPPSTPPPPAAPSPAQSAADQPTSVTPPLVPAIGSLGLAPSTFAALPRGPSARSSLQRPRGTTVSFRLNTSASVTFRVARRLPRRRCAQPRANRPGPPCRRRLALLAGRFTRVASAGLNRFRFTGRIGGRTLTPGAYQFQATPRTESSNGSLARATFRIVP